MNTKDVKWNLGLFWVLLAGFTVYFLSSVSSILFPFILALIVSYLFDPIVNKIAKFTQGRILGSIFVVLLFILLLIVITLFVIPLLAQDLLKLVQNIPTYINVLHDFINSFFAKHHDLYGITPDTFAVYVKPALHNFTTSAVSNVTPILHNMVISGFSIIHFVAILVLTPIVMFYMLKDWPILVDQIKELLPKNYKSVILNQAILVDKTLAGYLRGQFNVSMILAFYYAISLYLIGLNSGLLLGIMVGIFTFVPYVGIFIGIFVISIMSLMQFGMSLHILFVAGMFILGSLVESSFLTPKLIGSKVGLHPLWMLFGMLSGATLCGPYGVIVAVPVTAVIGVLIRFLVQQYLHSSYYKVK